MYQFSASLAISKNVLPLARRFEGNFTPARSSAFRCWYKAIASLLRPTFSRLSLPSALNRIHQTPLPCSFSQTPVAFAVVFRGMASSCENNIKVSPQVSPNLGDAKKPLELRGFGLCNLFILDSLS